MTAYFLLFFGVVCAAAGGELFVRGTVGLASWLRISPGIVAATVAAFATSSPELSVSISAAVNGTPQIGLGDALGSNVVNVALILGAALLISPIFSPRDTLKRDLPVAILVPIVTALFALDGVISRGDGILMVCMFALWLGATIVQARKQRSAVEEVLAAHRRWSVIASCIAGLAILFLAGHLIVDGARAIARSFGVSEFVIGATVVAVGTSVPELATTLVSKLRGHDEVGLGTVLGSNIFNGLLIVSVAAMIHPIAVPFRSVSFALVLGVAALALCFPNRAGKIERSRGVMLLGLYCVYVYLVLAS
ncbi:MAG TPA: calcium/sodium antiporter [Steroidobacteraceae bacterium]|nr:calcium/sodium antiporter [Steroidobacteraceae bacterium]